MSYCKFLTLCIIATICGLFAPAQYLSPQCKQTLADSLREKLSLSSTANDSVALIYNLLDIAEPREYPYVAKELLAVGQHLGDQWVQVDAIANIALESRTVEQIDSLQSLLQTLPKDADREIIETLLNTYRAEKRQFNSEQERIDEIKQLVVKLNRAKRSPNMSVYNRTAQLFATAIYVGAITDGAVLAEILDRLNREITKLPHDKGLRLKNKFYEAAAKTYLRNDQPEKSLMNDRKLLANIDRMQVNFRRHNRPYKSMQRERFAVLRRMLMNYPSLSCSEVDQLYSKLQHIISHNPELKALSEKEPIGKMALLMKQEKYAEAIPLVEKLLGQTSDIFEQRYYLRQLKTAAKATNNKALLLDAEMHYSDVLEQYMDMRARERLRELEVAHAFENESFKAAEELLQSHNQMLIGAAIALGIMLLMLLSLGVMLRRLSRRRKQLTASNQRLMLERAHLQKVKQELSHALHKTSEMELQKTKLINYITNEVMLPIAPIVEYSQMIIDNAQGENKRYLEQFMSVVAVNVALLQSLMSDVKEISMADSGKLALRHIPVDLNKMATLAAESTHSLLAKGVKLTLNLPTPPIVIDTDPQRVEMILLNLLNNAAKFTSQGEINVTLSTHPDRNEVEFDITDTGCGIPADKADVIFERFEKLNPEIEGTGLGLSVCRLIAKSLQARVELDTSHPGPGARFRFILSITPKTE